MYREGKNASGQHDKRHKLNMIDAQIKTIESK